MDNIQSHLDDNLRELIDQATDPNADPNVRTEAVKTLKVLAEVRPLLPSPDPTPDPVPETTWGKVKCVVSNVWDNETTRVLIKAGGTFGGVVLVVYSTILRDHVLERQALAQANQRNS